MFEFTGSLIRLVNGFVPNMGFVEVLANGTWGAVCGDVFHSTATGNTSWPSSSSWTASSARVACRQLGMPWSGARAFSGLQYYVNSTGPGTTGVAPFMLSRVRCMGNESALQGCLHQEGVSMNEDCTGHDSGTSRFFCRFESFRWTLYNRFLCDCDCLLPPIFYLIIRLIVIVQSSIDDVGYDL